MKKPKLETIQVTTAHFVDDERILHRMAWSLNKAGYRSRVVGFTGGEGEFCGIELDVISRNNRRGGMWQRISRMFNLISYFPTRRASLFQFHDPDLLLLAPLFKLLGNKVIYDVHDDYEASVLDRFSARPWLDKILAKLWWVFEKNVSRVFDGIVVADRHLAGKFKGLDPVILGNYPRLNFTQPADTSNEETFNIIYVGGVTKERGIGKVLDALQLLPYEDIRFHVIGDCKDAELMQRLRAEPRVILYGRVAWTDLHQYYRRAHLGVALYQPIASFLYCPGENAVKIIEYMAAAIPVLCSDFPGLVGFVEKGGYGLTVKPDDPKAISARIQLFYENRELGISMGRKGRHAFEEEYNWEKHEGKLIALYERILEREDQKIKAKASS